MSPIDDQLRTTLRQRAEGVGLNADPFQAIEQRARSIHRRRIAAAAAGTLAVIAGAAVAIPAATGALRADRSSGYSNGNDTVVTNPSPTRPSVDLGSDDVLGWGSSPNGDGPVITSASPDMTGTYPTAWGQIEASELLWVGHAQQDGSIPMVIAARTADGHIVVAGVIRPSSAPDRAVSVHDIKKSTKQVSVVLPYGAFGLAVVVTEPSIMDTERIRYRTAGSQHWVPVEALDSSLLTTGSAMFLRQTSAGDEIQVLDGHKVVYQGPIGRGVTFPKVTAATPPVARNIELYGDCTAPAFEPDSVVVTCADAGISFTHLQWKTWVATGALAVGTYYANDCKPSCAQGHFHSYSPINFTFTDPVRDAHGQLVWSRVTISPKPPDLPSATLTLPTNKI